jgi:hypothetical protein
LLSSDEAKQQIAFILEKMSALRPAEKLLLYLKMPGGHCEVGEFGSAIFLINFNKHTNETQANYYLLLMKTMLINGARRKEEEITI